MKQSLNKLGEILLEEGLISEEDLNEAKRLQSQAKDYKPIGRILVELNAITPRQLNYILDRFSKRPNLGAILKKSGFVTEQDIEKALQRQKQTGCRLGECLMELKIITEKDLRKALCAQLNIPFIDLDKISFDDSLSKLINKKYCEKRNLVPIGKMGSTLTLAMDDPTDDNVIDELSSFTGLKINVVTATSDAIRRAFFRLHGEGQEEREPSKVFRVADQPANQQDSGTSVSSEELKRADAVVGEIIKIGMKNAASDIHIESHEQKLVVRYRVDGVLTELPLGDIEGRMQNLKRQIVSRIKIMGKLDIAEKRRPQDGSFSAVLESGNQGARADFRISVVPGYYGENIVMRILDSRRAPQSIDVLGFSPNIASSLKALLRRNTGILLVAGPTGSGKSTTLYGALMSSYRPGIKILTAEDPVEYVYDGITQCQVNTSIGNSFANYIRSFLRQDPEIILVGEIRDAETAEMAFRAAQTGHLVLSTLHTNDAVGTIPRLLGLGVDPGVLASSLIGVVAQRLVRKVCPECKTAVQPDPELLQEFFGTPPTDIRWVAGGKCTHCNNTGYRGRIAVAELWAPEERDLFRINNNADIDELRESVRRSQRSVLMAQDALAKLRAEDTTLEELSRALPFSAIYEFRHLLGGASSAA